MQHHILYLAGLDRPHGTDSRTIARYEARARVERSNAVHDGFAALGRGVAALARDLARRVRRRRAAHATIHRLEALDDRTLADIGVHRSGIKALAWAEAERSTRPAGAPATASDAAHRDRAAAAHAQVDGARRAA